MQPAVVAIECGVTLVHCATITHKYGTNFYVALSLDGLTEAIDAYVKEWWETEIEPGMCACIENADEQCAFCEAREALGEHYDGGTHA